MNSGSLPLKVLAESNVFAGHGAKYVLTGGLNKEVKRILMRKNGVEEQEEDYATVWDWFSRAFYIMTFISVALKNEKIP